MFLILFAPPPLLQTLNQSGIYILKARSFPMERMCRWLINSHPRYSGMLTKTYKLINMKFIKLTALALLFIPFSSCLKPKNDFAGMRTDKGEVVTAMLEQQYLTGDANNLGFGYSIYSTFPFAGATENIRFFTLHISQPKVKLSGSLKVKI